MRIHLKRLPSVLLSLLCSSAAVFAGETTHAFHFKLPLERSFALEPANAGGKWLQAHAVGETNVTEFGDQVILQLTRPEGLPALIKGTGLKVSRKVGRNIFVLDAGTATNAVRQAHSLAGKPGVTASYPDFRAPRELHGRYFPLPSDKAFTTWQWPLENRNADGSQAGPDLNTRAAWPFTLGQGVTVAVADSGIELKHEELSNNAATGLHWNFVAGTTNGNPVNRFANGAHGTEVAGLLAAGVNNFRMAGAAPGAHLASWVITDVNTRIVLSDSQMMGVYEFESNTVDVQNHSWGVSGSYGPLLGPGLLESTGISNAIQFGRGGRGTIIVRSAGDGRGIQQDANDSGWANDPRVIAVAAIRSDGRVASYSDPGACVLVAAGGGEPSSGTFPPLYTTDLVGADGANAVGFFPPNQDLSDYVFSNLGFTGTSASAPQVSGVVALMLSVNTNLTWRDVQEILALSSRHFDFADPDVATNGAGFVVSHNVGFGIPDAGVAVALASLWTNRPTATNITFTDNTAQAIPPSGLNVVLADIDGTTLDTFIALEDLGKHADAPTPLLPLVDVGYGTNIQVSLTNKGALIERDANPFNQKLTNAAHAGAAFAVVYNYPSAGAPTNVAPGGDQLLIMGGTDFLPIPAVFIGNTDAETIKEVQGLFPLAKAQIALNSATYTFTVTNQMICAYASLRVMAQNEVRGNLRITLTSPEGTRSILDRYNSDISAGPADWTYCTRHCLYENSAGTWTVAVTDEGVDNQGQMNSVSLTINGVPATNGAPLSRLQVLESYLLPDPRAIRPDLSIWKGALARLSWTGAPGAAYQVWSATNVAGPYILLTNLTGTFPVTECFTPENEPRAKFYKVTAQ